MNAAAMNAGIFDVRPSGGVFRRPAAVAQGATARVAAAGAAGPGRMQLTRRGRFVLLGLPALMVSAVMLFAALAIVLGSVASPAQASASYASIDLADYAASVTVLQGDSLWSIAAAADTTRDVRDVVRDIVALNDLGSGVLQAGQRLYIPLRK